MFDLDNFGTQVREYLAGPRAGQYTGKIEYTQMRQHAH
jgi:hypothetical protein